MLGPVSTTSSLGSRYREIDVSGRPREMGRQVGEATAHEIQAFRDHTLEWIARSDGLSLAAALEIAAGSLAHVDRYDPHQLDELRGVADGSRVPLEHVMLLNVRNQLSADDSACTSLAWPAGWRGRGPTVAQNWDNDPSLDAFIVVVRRRPEHQAPILTVGPAGLIAYIGLNGNGIGACLNALPAPGRDSGVPHYFTLRGIFGSRDLDGAVAAVSRAQRAIPANIMLTTPQGPADLEVMIDEVHVLRPTHGDALTHTNHCLHPDLLAIAGSVPNLLQSRARKRRLDELLDGSGSPLDDPVEVLRDHVGRPGSICRHANGEREQGAWVTVFSVIIEPQSGRMRVSRGNPCTHPYETYLLA